MFLCSCQVCNISNKIHHFISVNICYHFLKSNVMQRKRGSFPISAILVKSIKHNWKEFNSKRFGAHTYKV